MKIKSPPQRSRIRIFFISSSFWQEEEENFDEIKEPQLKEVEEDFFLLEEKENFDENKEPPLIEVEGEYF